jgi:sugar phosphate isomerase/epimerase
LRLLKDNRTGIHYLHAANRRRVGSTVMRTISLAAGTILDVGPADAVDVAADAGFGWVGIWFDASTWSDAVADEVSARALARGVGILDIEPIMLTPAGSSANDHGDAIVDAAIRIGAHNILVASRDTDDARVADRLRALAALLAGTDIRLVLEFLPILGVRTLPQALLIVTAVGDPRVGVLVDSLHLARADHAPADLAALDADLLPYLQVCDAPAAPPDMAITTLLHEALHGRLLPGDGALPIKDLLTIVPAVPISLELRSEVLQTSYPDPVERARVVRLAMERVLMNHEGVDE